MAAEYTRDDPLDSRALLLWSAKVWRRVEDGVPSRVFFECSRDLIDDTRCHYMLSEESIVTTVGGVVAHLDEHMGKDLLGTVEVVVERVVEKVMKRVQEEAMGPPKLNPCGKHLPYRHI